MNAIITGGGGDIGGASARLLASRGANVLVVDANLGAAESVAREINEHTGATSVAQFELADVALGADVRRYVAAATAAWGPIDAVVHAAGIAGPAAQLPDFDGLEPVPFGLLGRGGGDHEWRARRLHRRVHSRDGEHL